MTLPRLKEFTSFWKKRPPVHVLVAAFFGHKPGGSATESEEESDSLEELIACFQQSGGKMGA